MSSLIEPIIINVSGFNFRKFGCLTLEEAEWNDSNIKNREKSLRTKELMLFDAIASENKLDSRAAALSLYRQWQSGKLTSSDSDVAASIELRVEYEGVLEDTEGNINTSWIVYLLNQRTIVDDSLKTAYKTLFKKEWAGAWLYTDLVSPVFKDVYLPIRKFLSGEVQSIDDDETATNAVVNGNAIEPKTVGES